MMPEVGVQPMVWETPTYIEITTKTQDYLYLHRVPTSHHDTECVTTDNASQKM